MYESPEYAPVDFIWLFPHVWFFSYYILVLFSLRPKMILLPPEFYIPECLSNKHLEI